MVGKTEIQQDMYELAKHVYEVSKKYGKIYITSTACMGQDYAFTTYQTDKDREKGTYPNEYYTEDAKQD